MCQGPHTGLGCLRGGAWANTYMTFAILDFCLLLHIFHQQSFISEVNPEEVSSPGAL